MVMTERTRKKSRQTATRPRRKPAAVVVLDSSLQQLQAEIDQKVVQLTESNRQLKRKIFDLYTVFEISRNFNAVLKYQSLLDTFIFTCLGQVGALKGAIFLKKEREAGRFHLVQAKGSGTFPQPEQSFQTNSRLLAYLTRLNRPALTGDVMNDISSDEDKAILVHFDPGIVVPLIYQTRLIGIFALSDKMSGRKFQMDDVEFLSILGNQIAVAIENARLYEGERMATQQLRVAQEQLIQTEKLAALGEMSAKVAHEVNNPLGIIKNYLLLIKRGIDPKSETNKQAVIVEQEIDRIAGIVRQLLEFHRQKPIPFEKLNIREIADNVLILTERLLASNRITVHVDIADSCPQVMGEPQGLKQVFLNLIINARDAMPEGGSLKIRAREGNSMVVITFCDSGPGISPEVLPRIFDPFFTTKEPGKGTGLGLSVCYGVIKSHGGSITFRNTEPGGCFEIKLPAAAKEIEHESGA
jgi:signal transduction histidine kinase